MNYLISGIVTSLIICATPLGNQPCDGEDSGCKLCHKQSHYLWLRVGYESQWQLWLLSLFWCLVCLDRDVIIHLHMIRSVSSTHNNTSAQITLELKCELSDLNTTFPMSCIQLMQRNTHCINTFFKVTLWQCPADEPRLAPHFTVNEKKDFWAESSGTNQHFRTDMQSSG